jgi:hypothetical protein
MTDNYSGGPRKPSICLSQEMIWFQLTGARYATQYGSYCGWLDPCSGPHI